MKDATHATLALNQDTASQLAEIFIWSCEKRQGTALAVPIEQ
jgi:hypothetical protein